MKHTEPVRLYPFGDFIAAIAARLDREDLRAAHPDDLIVDLLDSLEVLEVMGMLDESETGSSCFDPASTSFRIYYECYVEQETNRTFEAT